MINIAYKTKKPYIDEYWDLFNSTDWNEEYHFTKKELDSAIKNSWYSVAAYVNNKLIGYGRIISDGVHHALIVDLIILPKFQKKDIGSKILLQLIEKCKKHHIRDIQLFSAENNYPFYEKFGFKKRKTNAPGMELKR